MGLADKAAQTVAQAADTQEQAQKKALRAEGAKAKEQLELALRQMDVDEPVVYLNSEKGTHVARMSQRFGPDYMSTAHHTLHRMRVDDVVIVRGYGVGRPSSAAWEWYIEQPCARCRRPAYVAPGPGSGGLHRRNGEISSLSSSPEKEKAAFISWIGQAVRGEYLCWDCQAQVGGSCPTCTRSFSATTMKWSEVNL